LANSSLVSRMGGNITIPSKSRLSALRSKIDAATARKRRTYVDKTVAVDVYIPSTVSVGTLGRLLNVRLGVYSDSRIGLCWRMQWRAVATKNGEGGDGRRIIVWSR
jgi:hypothetical protein